MLAYCKIPVNTFMFDHYGVLKTNLSTQPTNTASLYEMGVFEDLDDLPSYYHRNVPETRVIG
jgi:hypothetical protein